MKEKELNGEKRLKKYIYILAHPDGQEVCE